MGHNLLLTTVIMQVLEKHRMSTVANISVLNVKLNTYHKQIDEIQ